MAAYREERTFRVEVRLHAEFADDYDGDEDGYAWVRRWNEVLLPRVVSAVFASLRSDPGWRVMPISRGHSPEDVLEISMERIVS